MMMTMDKETSHCWWFDSHSTSMRSLWLQSTLGELEVKTKAMLKLIEEDADSFAKRAEMYYKKRPELISMVEEFYRAYRSLAERYDQLRPNTGNRLVPALASPFSAKHLTDKSFSMMDQNYESHSETYDVEEGSAESEIDDPLPEDELQDTGTMEFADIKVQEVKLSSSVYNDEILKLRAEIERLKEENRIQNEQLSQKDNEKEEVLSFATKMQLTENVNLAKSLATGCSNKHKNNSESRKLKETHSGIYDVDEYSAESEIDEPLQEGTNTAENVQKLKFLRSVNNVEILKLREEIKRVKEENRMQKEQLSEKDDNKREVIRQLSLSIEMERTENGNLRKILATDCSKRHNSNFEFRKLKETLLGKWFKGRKDSMELLLLDRSSYAQKSRK